MIRINLHDYRDELRKIEIQKRLVKSFSIVITAIVLIIVAWLIVQVKLDSIKSETRKLESQVGGLKKQVDKVNAMEARQKRLEDIIKGIEKLREKQLPASTLVGDLNFIIPKDLWLVSIVQRDLGDLKQRQIPVIMYGDPSKKMKRRNKKKKKSQALPKEFVEITGFALTENGVLEYIKNIEKIPYYQTVFLYKSVQTFVESQTVYRFTIFCYMPEKKGKK